MAVELADVLTANLVLVGVELLDAPDAFERFRGRFGGEVRVEVGLISNAGSGVTEASRTLTLGRDRVELVLHGSRSTIAIAYPDEGGLARLAEVASCAIDLTEIQEGSLRAYGYNMELVFNQDSEEPAIEYIGRRLFANRFIGEQGWAWAGGSGRLVYGNSDEQWAVSIEPRFNEYTESRLFVKSNLHKEGHSMPAELDIRTALQRVRDEASAFARRLDKAGMS